MAESVPNPSGPLVAGAFALGAGLWALARHLDADGAAVAPAATAECSSALELYMGLEGGGTQTTLCLVDSKARILATVNGKASNPWLVGVDVACARVIDLVDRAFDQAKAGPEAAADPALAALLARAVANGPVGSGPASADATAALASAGLSVSGCAEEANQVRLRAAIMAARPSLVPRASALVIGNDTVGAAFTAAPSGGLVLICGTGTMGEAFLPDGRAYRCGGWGHMLGDEAGGYWVVHRALAAAFRADDGFDETPGVTPPDPRPVLSLACAELGRSTKSQLLADFYGEGFDKSRVAALAKPLAALARDKGDAIAVEAFQAAGRQLGGVVRTLAPHMRAAGVPEVVVVAVGSVWHAFDLMAGTFEAAARADPIALAMPGQPGFVDGPRSKALRAAEADPSAGTGAVEGAGLRCGVRLVRLRVTAALGAASLAARQAAGVSLPVDYSDTTTTLADFPAL
ncbi:hypothetical protein FNF31_04747 [Cafeteria roenbergensis]|uniref:N-acetyl-D-glucosamine kinase n=1 Tax=Cafeteria roenbergensis TaxID=33653 RepID=A0A5A8D389_CAFRO|nr:hypothetical protein FNF31_04747 [Cafeteria roenbergensis]KAA0159806.1 hypothetical protein FNF28_05660 [Cafeteria roenbergensis]